MNEQDKLIEKQFKTLPLDLQQAINAVPWKSLIQEVGKANALKSEQIATLEQETMLVIYAFEPPEDYIANIVREVGVSEDIASTIAESVLEKIFRPISEKGKNQADSQKKKPSPAPSLVPEIAPEIHPMVKPASAFSKTKQTYGETQSAQGLSEAKKRGVAHTVPQVKQPPPKPRPPRPSSQPLPNQPKPQIRQTGSKPQETREKPKHTNNQYPGGKDPYREPLV